jgi:hypothetical protein
MPLDFRLTVALTCEPAGMRRAYKFLLRPTTRQAARLVACLEDHRQFYNGALEHRRTAYRRAGITVRYGDQSAELKQIRCTDQDGQGRWSFSSQQATLRRLDRAFAAFFRRVQAGQAPGYRASRAEAGSTRSPGPPTATGAAGTAARTSSPRGCTYKALGTSGSISTAPLPAGSRRSR